MPRPRHAMRVHPLRTKGVVVGIPVAAAVAFGAHSVLGVTPLSDQQETSSSASTTPQAAAPVQSYGLAQAPPPTTLGLLSAPTDAPAPAASGAAGSSSGSTAASPVSRTTTEPIAAPSHTVPIAPAAAPKPSMMTFSGAPQQAAAPVRQAAAPVHDEAPQQEAAHQQAAPQQAPQQQGGGGSLLGVDLGVAKVSVLSFG